MVLDNEHNLLSGKKSFPPPYRLKPCTSFIVDGTAFDFDLSEKFGEHVPDTLMIMVSAEQAYTVRWSHDDRRVALSVATMIPLGKSPPFTGLKSGEFYILTIGYLAETPADMAWAWSGGVKVR